MKTIFCLPFIVLVLLCNCKSDSFIKQRYTGYAHNSHKNFIKDKNVARQQTTVEQKPDVLPNSEATTVSASAEKDIRMEDIIIPTPYSIEFNAVTNTIQKKNVENAGQANPIVKGKKATHQKSHVAKRILGTLLKIVLWIIILAVVVGIIIIIGALA